MSQLNSGRRWAACTLRWAVWPRLTGGIGTPFWIGTQPC